MKRILYVLLCLFTFVIYFDCFYVFAADKSKIILSTTDIDTPYDIIGIVSYKTGEPDVDVVNRGIMRQAARLNATNVVGIRYFSSAGFFYGYGTAVKTKE